MHEVLSRWGQRTKHEEYATSVDWRKINAVCPLAQRNANKLPSCSDNDGVIIDSCIGRLNTLNRHDEVLMLGLRFIGGCSLRRIAKVMEKSLLEIRTALNSSEAFLEGCLSMLEVPLDMDDEVRI